MKTKDKQASEKMLKTAGLQVTAQRVHLCDFIFNQSDHPTAEEVWSWAQKNIDQMSRATVYNTLNSLVDAGLLKTLRMPHSDKLVFDFNVSEHFHFIDEKTGRIEDLDPKDLSWSLKLPKGWKKSSMEVFIKGRK